MFFRPLIYIGALALTAGGGYLNIDTMHTLIFNLPVITPDILINIFGDQQIGIPKISPQYVQIMVLGLCIWGHFPVILMPKTIAKWD
jgi:hypothetical protein